ncbi:MAG: putative glycoside hydrolase [Angelakisella sp.]
MPKQYKVRRYSYQWSGQKKQQWKRRGLFAVGLLVAGAVGWFAFDPVFQLVTNLPVPSFGGSSVVQPLPEPVAPSSQPLPESSQPAPEPVPEFTGALPESMYYLAPAVVEQPQLLSAELAKIKAAGGTGVVFDLKDSNGIIRYASELPLVATNLAQPETPFQLETMLETIRAAGLTPVGRIYTFRDPLASGSWATYEGSVKYMDGQVNWLDKSKADGGKSWLNPNSAVARDYLLGIIEEAAGKGVPCLLLDGVQFPVGQALHLASFGGTPDRSQVLADFVAAAVEKTARYHTDICPVVLVSGAAGINEIPYGATPEKLAAAAGRVLLDVRPEQFGIGVTHEKLTLTSPLLTPGETVTAAMKAAAATTELSELELGAMIQCYTATGMDSTANKPYGDAEQAAQKQAATEAGATSIWYYTLAG